MRRLGSLVACAGCLLSAAACAPALRQPPPLEDLAGQAGEGWSPDRLHEEAAARFAERTLVSVRQAAELWTRAAQRDPSDLDALVGAVRARVWLAEHEGDAEGRRRSALEAVQTAQWCESREPGSPLCAYWLGVALGVQARERRATALDALPRIEALFLQAAEAAPGLEQAGPDRALALLYARAPGWPSGPGDPDRALEHARRAVAQRPDYAPNQLALAEALRAVGEDAASRETYRRALELAQQALDSGEPDAPTWAEEARRGLGDPGSGASHPPVATPGRER